MTPATVMRLAFTMSPQAMPLSAQHCVSVPFAATVS